MVNIGEINMSSIKYDKQFHTVCSGRTLALIKGIQGYYGMNKQESFEKSKLELMESLPGDAG